MKRTTFYHCKKCGNIALKVNDGGGKMVCCGEEMGLYELNPSGAAEKHAPCGRYITDDIFEVAIGEVAHPMEEDHYIEWVYLVTQHGVQAICLAPGAEPKAQFSLYGDKPLAVFAFCNKHGLWKTDVSNVAFEA